MADSSSAPIRVICGPTAAGKTVVATAFARLADVTVVSADSRQLYKGFDIGTVELESGAMAYYFIGEKKKKAAADDDE